MALKKQGNIRESYGNGVAIQPNYTLTEKNDGSIEGSVTFECDIDDFFNLPQMKSAHPRDSRCELYNREITYMGLRKVKLVGSYLGLVAATTEPVVSSNPNTNKDKIESHPDFATFATPANGAVFDADTGEFLGFFDKTIKGLFGEDAYLTPASLVSLTYWTSSVPRTKKPMSIVSSIKGFIKPEGVKEFMVLASPYRQIGSFYQVTDQYMGSGPDGFSRIVYPQ